MIEDYLTQQFEEVIKHLTIGLADTTSLLTSAPVFTSSLQIPVTDELLRDVGVLEDPFKGGRTPARRDYLRWVRDAFWRVRGAIAVLRGASWGDEYNEDDW